MDINEYKLYNDLSLLGELAQNDYDNYVLHDILNSSEFCNDTSLDLSELIPDFQREPFGLHLSSNPISLEFSSNTMASSSAISAETKRNINDTNFQLEFSNSRIHMPNAYPEISLSNSNVNDTSNELTEGAPHPLIVDSDKTEQFFEPTKVTSPKEEVKSIISNLSDIKNELQETSQDLGFTLYNKRINSSLTNSWPLSNVYTDHQISKTDLPLSKTIKLTSHDYKPLMQTVKCNKDRAFKRSFNVGSKISNIVIKKKNATFIQSFKESTQAHTMNEKIYKKHQRMIKNRESASLSRKKRKEYVVSLETRVNTLEKECDALRAFWLLHFLCSNNGDVTESEIGADAIL
ncbi:probable basic-leucine zipper transcription factor G isoform X3 [Drosophila erecta]|uniref:probable basic-leucine zipper transcription factor G isoform X3 n=1 Tax=Drosophila erecta TaxID=7220 RepID=UPI000F05DFF7|nr:probable basic-leucine zipper transcription factor G isoform X3 [Drosophila erecta]